MEKLLKQLIELYQKLIALLIIQNKNKDYIAFREALGKRESGGNYKIVNAYGYLGKYQFGMARLSDLGYTERIAGTTDYHNSAFYWKAGFSKEYFLNNPDFQDRVFKEHIGSLIKQIKLKYFKYLGKQINNIEITLSGLVAGAHLGGIGGIGKFLAGNNSSDQFGTRVSDYIKEFSNYDLES